MTTLARDLPDALAAELAAAKPFADLKAACALIEGVNGSGGIRGNYVQRLCDAQSAEKLSDDLFISISREIGRLCARELALLAVPNDREHAGGRGCILWPATDSLTEAERSQL